MRKLSGERGPALDTGLTDFVGTKGLCPWNWRNQLADVRGLGIIDTLIVLVLISIMIGVLIPRYLGIAEEARETALQSGLLNIRMAVGVYRMVNQRYPENLKDLINKRFILPVREDTIFTQEYLRAVAVDADGYPLDPFGNRYRYDPISGYVASTTEGYENW